MRRLVPIASVLLLVALFVPAALADAPQDIANRISEQVMSPFCPGVTLHDCPSDNAIQLRAQIARWAAKGSTTKEIMARLLTQYPDIRAVPSDKGASLLVWLLPGIAVLLGAGTALVLARRWAGHRDGREPPSQLAPEDRQRVEDELALVRGEA